MQIFNYESIIAMYMQLMKCHNLDAYGLSLCYLCFMYTPDNLSNFPN